MKHLFTYLLILVTGITISQNIGSTPYPASNIISLYQFENGNELFDASRSGNDLTLVNSPTFITDRFSMAPTSAASLSSGSFSRADVAYTGGAFGQTRTIARSSIGFWFKSNTSSIDPQIIYSDYTGNPLLPTNSAGFAITLDNGQIRIITHCFNFNASVPITEELISTRELLNDDTWHHIVAIINDIDDRPFGEGQVVLKIYIDGTLSIQRTSAVVRYANLGNNTGNYRSLSRGGTTGIGSSTGATIPTVNQFNGSLDDLAIYNGELTAAEISNIANEGNFCFRPDALTIDENMITTTASSASFPVNGRNIYEFGYHKASESFSNLISIGTPILINSNIVTINNLDEFEDYKLYVREICPTNTTAWSAPFNFTTKRILGRIYVDIDATGSNNGTSWTNAYTNLQDALQNITDGEDIWVAEGVYRPSTTGDKNASFVINNDNIGLYGGFNGTETQLSERSILSSTTTLSGDLSQNDNYTLGNFAVFFQSFAVDNSKEILQIEGSFSIIDGFTISGVSNGQLAGSASAIIVGKSNVVQNMTLQNCTVENNRSPNAASALSFVVKNIASGFNDITIDKTIFRNNACRFGNIYFLGDVEDNTSTSYEVTVNISNTLFEANGAVNTASGRPGTMGSALLINKRRKADQFTLNLANCTVVANQDLGTASGTSNLNRSPVTLADTSGSGSAGFNANISNCIFWGNTAVNGVRSISISKGNLSADPIWAVNHTTDEDNFSSIPNVNVTNSNNTDPLFVDATNSDYQLSSNSPAIDSGNNNTVFGGEDILQNPRFFGLGVDKGAYEFNPSLSIVDVNDNTTLKLYPNPTHSTVTIETFTTLKTSTIYSALGKKVMQSTQNVIDVSQLETGVYFIKIEDVKGNSLTKRFIKQ